jgi:2-deoxy-D-gluconate 3-dehydrogenase
MPRKEFDLSQLAARQMIKANTGGKIIILGSMAAFQGGLHIPAYVASKGGVTSLTRALAVEWSRHRINVNAIAPGYFRTDMTTSLELERGPELTARIPAGRWGESEDLAGAAVFLASKASDYCCGATLVVDGGWLSL